MIKWLINLIRRIFAEPIYYINGPETLPPPLDRQREDQLVKRYADGDSAAKEELIVHNLRLVVYIAKKFDSQSSNVEDMISIGTIGLIKAVNTFKPDKNIKLATYASRCIENEILMHLRKVSSQRVEMSIDEPLNIDWDGNELLLSDILGSDSDAVNAGIEHEDELNTLSRLISDLTPREQQIMNLRFGLGGGSEHTQKEVADLLGISQSYISRLEKRIISQLASRFN